MRHTTDHDRVNPYATTPASQRAIHERLKSVFARHEQQQQLQSRHVLHEPSLFWEEPGLHGERRAARLRPPGVSGRISPLTRGRVPHHALARPTAIRGTDITRLPPLPFTKRITAKHVVITAGVVGAVALGVYLWRKNQVKK